VNAKNAKDALPSSLSAPTGNAKNVKNVLSASVSALTGNAKKAKIRRFSRKNPKSGEI
jgi:hypothetical protein